MAFQKVDEVKDIVSLVLDYNWVFVGCEIGDNDGLEQWRDGETAAYQLIDVDSGARLQKELGSAGENYAETEFLAVFQEVSDHIRKHRRCYHITRYHYQSGFLNDALDFNF